MITFDPLLNTFPESYITYLNRTNFKTENISPLAVIPSSGTRFFEKHSNLVANPPWDFHWNRMVTGVG